MEAPIRFSSQVSYKSTVLNILFCIVDTGHKAFLFNKYSGVKEVTYREGLHFRIPLLEEPVIYNVKT